MREREGGRERPAILQLSGRYGSHEAAQPYRKRRAQGKGKDKQGQWHGGGGGGGCMERIRGGGVNGVQGLCVRWCSVGVVLIFLLLQCR